MSQDGIVSWRRPHHCDTCSQLEWALKTSSRGASNSRVMTIEWSGGSESVDLADTARDRLGLFLGRGHRGSSFVVFLRVSR